MTMSNMGTSKVCSTNMARTNGCISTTDMPLTVCSINFPDAAMVAFSNARINMAIGNRTRTEKKSR